MLEPAAGRTHPLREVTGRAVGRTQHGHHRGVMCAHGAPSSVPGGDRRPRSSDAQEVVA
jgi:hypothetical protein